MMREFYKCKHFDIKELVDKQTYDKFGEQAWMFFDDRILITLDNIREYFNKPVTVNNWSVGGSYDSRGLRRPTDPTGASFSQHRFGRAIDFSVKDMTADEVRKIILDGQDNSLFQYIKRIEKDTSWVHIDCANVDSEDIVLFKG
jgi:hypothetical protein